MNSYPIWSETTTDKTNGRLELPADASVLGTDRRRAIHYYSRATNQIVVVDTADLVNRYDLSRHSLLTWVTYIALECGWHDLDDAEWFLDRLAEALVRP